MSTNTNTQAVAAEPILTRRDDDGVATLTLNRPAQFNSLSRALMSEMQDELARIAADAGVRVVVLAGAGKAFCAGHDLKEMRTNPAKEFQRALFDQCSKLMLTLVRLPQPVIARVHGIATAAGCQLVSMYDLAVASDNSRFAVSGVKYDGRRRQGGDRRLRRQAQANLAGALTPRSGSCFQCGSLPSGCRRKKLYALDLRGGKAESYPVAGIIVMPAK